MAFVKHFGTCRRSCAGGGKCLVEGETGAGVVLPFRSAEMQAEDAVCMDLELDCPVAALGADAKASIGKTVANTGLGSGLQTLTGEEALCVTRRSFDLLRPDAQAL